MGDIQADRRFDGEHQHLQGYLNEYAFRYNHRADKRAMFRTVGQSIKGVKAGRYGRYAPIG